MSLLSIYPRCSANCLTKSGILGAWRGYSLAEAKKPQLDVGDDDFRVLNFIKKREKFQKRVVRKEPVPPPRAEQMKIDQKWSDVWPGPRTFHPACVPLPMRQGYPLPKKAPPGAFANTELMKIPNFLHLSPPAVRSHCEAIKKFCTPWPKGLEDDEKCDKHFPLEVITSDYCHSGPSIRNDLSRIVTIRIKLSEIPLDYHAKDKLRRLVGEKYDPDTDILTIVTDRCPMRQQNMDYAMYLLTAVYYESWKKEPWEDDRVEADMEVYIWERNPSKKSLVQWVNYGKKLEVTQEDVDNFDLSTVDGAPEYKEAISDLMNEGENEYQYSKYKEAVKRLFGLQKDNLVIDKVNKM